MGNSLPAFSPDRTEVGRGAGSQEVPAGDWLCSCPPLKAPVGNMQVTSGGGKQFH